MSASAVRCLRPLGRAPTAPIAMRGVAVVVVDVAGACGAPRSRGGLGEGARRVKCKGQAAGDRAGKRQRLWHAPRPLLRVPRNRGHKSGTSPVGSDRFGREWRKPAPSRDTWRQFGPGLRRQQTVADEDPARPGGWARRSRLLAVASWRRPSTCATTAWREGSNAGNVARAASGGAGGEHGGRRG